MNSWTQMHSGKRFDFFNPNYHLVDINDIAHALPWIARWNAHSRWFYSVGAHCIQVSKRIELAGGTRSQQLEGLLHDASEAYLSDLPSPIKKQFPEVVAAENIVHEAIFKRFGLSWPMSKIVHDADKTCLVREAEEMFFRPPSWIKEYPIPGNMKSSENIHILQDCISFPNPDSLSQTEQIREIFMERFITLGGSWNA